MTVEERAPAIVGVPGGHHAGRHQGRRQRQHAAGQGLGRADQVGRDAGGLVRPEPARSTAAGHNFVGNPKHAMAPGRRGQRRQLGGRVHPHPAGALHQRLDNDRRHLAGARVSASSRRSAERGTISARNNRGSKRPKNVGSRLTDIAPNVSP